MNLLVDIYTSIAAFFVQLGMLLTQKLIRIEKYGFENLHQSSIYAFWHEAYFVVGFANPFEKVAVLTTKGVMGDIVSKAIKIFNPKIIRASFDGGAKQSAYAVFQMIKSFQEGYALVIVPDGPKGPRRKSKSGIFFIAEKTGAKIIPVGIAANRKITLHFRWDKYFIPLPFSKVVIFADKPFSGPHETILLDKALENARKKAEELVMKN